MRVQKGLSYTCHLMSHKKEDIELACPKLKYTEGRKFVWGYGYNKPFQANQTWKCQKGDWKQ